MAADYIPKITISVLSRVYMFHFFSCH